MGAASYAEGDGMIVQTETNDRMRPDQVRAIAHGLCYLASIDGIDDREKELIQSFLKDGNVELDLENLGKIPFSIEELTHGLDTIFLRKTFLRIGILLAKADGAVSSQEMAELRRIAVAMGIDEPLESMTEDLETKSLE